MCFQGTGWAFSGFFYTFAATVCPWPYKWAATWQNQQNECAPSEDSDQPGHSPSLFRVFAVRKKKAWVVSYPLSAQRRLWSDWADAQAYLSLRWAHTHFVGFIMSWLKRNWSAVGRMWGEWCFETFSVGGVLHVLILVEQGPVELVADRGFVGFIDLSSLSSILSILSLEVESTWLLCCRLSRKTSNKINAAG